MGYPLIFKVICIQWSFCSRCWCHFFRFDWKKRSLEDMPNCCFCSPYLFYVTEQTYASSMGSPKPPSLFPSFIRRHTFLTENWLLTHDSVVSFRRVCVCVLNTIIVCCDIDIPFNPLNTKSVWWPWWFILQNQPRINRATWLSGAAIGNLDGLKICF